MLRGAVVGATPARGEAIIGHISMGRRPIMPSPFPGMDPYLEQHWGDVHTRMVTYASDALRPFLPRDLRARVEERLVVSAADHTRPIYPDVRVFESSRRAERPANGATGHTVTVPHVIE